MRIKIRPIIIIGIAVAFMAWVLLGNLYWMREDSSGQLLWKGDKAYLFAMVARRGRSVKVISFPWEVLGEWLNAPAAAPIEEHAFLVVIRVTPSGVERYPQKGVGNTAELPTFFTPIGETIYALCRGTLCKWVGDHFEDASVEEQNKLGGISQLKAFDGPINGWSKLGVGSVVGDFHYAVDLGNNTRLRIQQGNVNRSMTDSATLYLDRSGQPSQQLWHIDGTPRLVSRWKYKQSFLSP
jgi:hypothetical protein